MKLKDINNLVIQPGSADKVCTQWSFDFTTLFYLAANTFDNKRGIPKDDYARIMYNFYDVNNGGERNKLFLNYVFCEVFNNHRSTSNTLLQFKVFFKSVKSFVSDNDTMNKIWKISRMTSLIVKYEQDKLKTFKHNKFSNIKSLIIDSMSSDKFDKY